ncbi:organic cation/carnitine transporter 7-like [Pieris napi]|uniref:organic cation/carnitine transporter 7-like n=1 Tax=Pieris napi TaxID=78633 RepID=UPI001FB912CC|nr:organic cation/carnitine transporter 7-like [Pieris napi]
MDTSRKVPFEEALNLTGFGKFNYVTLLVNVLVILSVVFEIYSVSYVVPTSACDLQTTVYQQGLIASTPMAGIILTSNFWGYLADTRGRRKIVILSLLLSFSSSTLACFSPNWICLFIFKFISSTALAGTYPLGLTILGEFTPAHKRAIIVAMIGTVFTTSFGLLGILSIPISNLKFSYHVPILDINLVPWRLLNFLTTTPAAIAAFATYLTYETPKFLLSVGEEEKALDVLRRMFNINTGKGREEYQVHSLFLDESSSEPSKSLWASIKSQTTPLLKPPLLKNTLILSFLFSIVYFVINPFYVWLPVVANAIVQTKNNGQNGLTLCETLRYSENLTVAQSNECAMNSTAMFTVFIVTLVLGSLNAFLSATIEHIGKKRLLICVQIISGLTGLGINFSAHWAMNSVLFLLFLVGILNFGFLCTFSVDMFPTYVKAMAICLSMMIGRGVSVIGINVVKSMLTYNCELAFYCFPALAFIGAFTGLLLPGDKKSEEKENSI